MLKYASRYGLIIKSYSSLPEYHYKGKFVARGSSICISSNPLVKPTSEDWKYCLLLREDYLKREGR